MTDSGNKKAILYTDGASRGNPGDAGIGAAIYAENGELIHEIARYIGTTTNNVAEYTAMIEGLRWLVAQGYTEVLVRCDSELMVKQMRGEYRVKSPGLQGLFTEARRLFMHFQQWNINHVPREQNKKADSLANLGIDQAKGR